MAAILRVNDVRGDINAHVHRSVAFLERQQVSKLFLAPNGLEVRLKNLVGVFRVGNWTTNERALISSTPVIPQVRWSAT